MARQAFPHEWVGKNGDGIVAVDGEQTIRAWNKSAEALLGHSEADVIGRKCYDVMHGRLPSGKRVCQAGCAMKRRATKTASLGEMTILVRHALGEHLELTVRTVSLPSFGDGCTVHLVRRAGDLEPAATRAAWLTESSLSDITRREASVLGALGRGMSTLDIARHLSVSPLTVRTHVRNVMRKKNLHTRLQLALFARTHGLA